MGEDRNETPPTPRVKGQDDGSGSSTLKEKSPGSRPVWYYSRGRGRSGSRDYNRSTVSTPEARRLEGPDRGVYPWTPRSRTEPRRGSRHPGSGPDGGIGLRQRVNKGSTEPDGAQEDPGAGDGHTKTKRDIVEV